MTDLCVRRYPVIQYDGTNSAAIMTFAEDSANTYVRWTLHSEINNVLVLRARYGDGPDDFSDQTVNVTDYVIGSPREGLYGIYPADLFAAQWHILA